MRSTTLLLSGLAFFLGCNDQNPVIVVTSPAVVGVVADTTAVASSVMFAATDSFTPITAGVVIRPEDAATAAAAAVNRYFTPTGCASAVVSGTTVTYTLNGCAGPLGVTGLSGSATVAYSMTQNGVIVTASSNNLMVGATAVTINAHALYTQSGNARSLALTNTSVATGTDGTTFAQNQTGTLSWNQGDTCVMQNSMGATAVNGTALTQSDVNVMRCTNQCPQSGSITIRTSAGDSAVLQFNGTNHPPVAGSAGNAGTIPLSCPAT
jgi:hypothetical protein